MVKNAAMEGHVREKQANNEEFAFLTGGDGADYYEYLNCPSGVTF